MKFRWSRQASESDKILGGSIWLTAEDCPLPGRLVVPLTKAKKGQEAYQVALGLEDARPEDSGYINLAERDFWIGRGTVRKLGALCAFQFPVVKKPYLGENVGNIKTAVVHQLLGKRAEMSLYALLPDVALVETVGINAAPGLPWPVDIHDVRRLASEF